MSCLYLNARSLLNKVDIFQATVQALKPDIIGITESWTSSMILDAELNMEGYDLFRCDRPIEHRGGGVLLYVSTELEATEFRPSTEYPEQVWCRLQEGRGRSTVIGVCYRTPTEHMYGKSNHSKIRDLMDEISTENFVLMGDFNYPNIQWQEGGGPGGGATEDERLFWDCIEDNFITQHVDVPTRYGSTLDLVLTRDPDVVTSLSDVGKLEGMDHTMLQWNLELGMNREHLHAEIRDYCKADYEGMRSELNSVRWEEKMGKLQTEDAWSFLRQLIDSLVQTYVPVRKVRKAGKKKPMWMTHNAVKMVKKKHKIFRKFKTGDHPACKQASKVASCAVRKARRNFENKLAENIKSDNKSFYAYVRSMSRSRVGPGPLVDENGDVVASAQEMSDRFNGFFASVFTKENEDRIPEVEQCYTGLESEALQDLKITEDMIRGRLSKMRADKAAGDDGISSRLLRELQNELAAPLCILFNKSLQEGTIPEDWRTANVTPIFKKGRRCEIGNYRPVSLTSQISKLMESLIRDAVVEHLERNKLIRNSQHGFRGGRSCLSNLLAFLDKVTRSQEEGDSVDVIYLDFAKAFDKVPHGRLRAKLSSHGIQGKVWNWISGWLSNRKQRVCMQGRASTWRPVISGVPQGSVLGPVLFLIFINDLDSGILNWVLKFADDTKLFSSIPDQLAAERLQHDLDRLVQWSTDWQMSFNVDKCKVMHIGRNNPKHTYTMEGRDLQEITEETDLGVIVTSDLRSADQCKHAYNRASRMLGMVGRTIHSRAPSILLQIYKSIVRPHLEYCSPAWSPYYKKDKEILERVQHRFTRMFPKLRELDYMDRLKLLGLWTLEERRNRADLEEIERTWSRSLRWPRACQRLHCGHCLR